MIYSNAGPLYNTSSNLVIDPSSPATLYRINPLQKSADGGISWTPTGFTGPITNSGIAVALAVDPRNSNTLYVSSTWNTGHAIYKSMDGGQSWNAVDTIIPAAASFVFSPDSSTIYAATGGGVFKSTDGGLNWSEAKTGLRVFDIEVLVGDPVNRATVYAGGNEGLFRSVDGGANWTTSETFLGADSLLIDFTNSNTLYVRKASPNGCSSGEIDLLKSTDGGSSWSDLEPDPYHGCGDGGTMAMDPVDPNTLYVVFGNDYDGFTIFKTTDGGAHWKNLYADALGEASQVNALVIDSNTPATLYAATDIGVFRSTDGGTSFLPDGFANTRVLLLATDPVRSNVLYAATSNNDWAGAPAFLGLYKSTDSGASWSPINQGLDEIVAAHPCVNALLVDADRADILYLATSGYGVFKSSDGGATWAAFNSGLTNLDVRSLALVRPGMEAHRDRRPDALSPDTLYAGTPGGVFKIR